MHWPPLTFAGKCDVHRGMYTAYFIDRESAYPLITEQYVTHHNYIRKESNNQFRRG